MAKRQRYYYPKNPAVPYATATGKPEEEEAEEDDENKKPWWVYVLIGLAILVLILLTWKTFSKWGSPVDNSTILVNGTVPLDEFGLPPWLSIYNATNSTWQCPYDQTAENFTRFAFERTVVDPISGKVLTDKYGQPLKEVVACSVPASGFSVIWRDHKGAVLLFLLAVIVGGYFLKKRADEARGEEDKEKLYDMEETLVLVVDILKLKGFEDFKPTEKMTARTDTQSYRYMFEEMLLPEINDHQPYGFKKGKKKFALIEMNYNGKMLHFEITDDEHYASGWARKPDRDIQNNREYRAIMNNLGKDAEMKAAAQGRIGGMEPYGSEQYGYPPSLRNMYYGQRRY